MALRFIKRMYYQGKVVAYLKKNGSVLRYKLASIEERYLTSLYRVKPYYPLANAEELNKEIDSLEAKIDEVLNLASEGLTEDKRLILYESLALISNNLERLCEKYN